MLRLHSERCWNLWISGPTEVSVVKTHRFFLELCFFISDVEFQFYQKKTVKYHGQERMAEAASWKMLKKYSRKKYAKHCFSYELAAEIVSKIQDNKQCALMVRYSLLFAQRDLKSVEQSHNGAKSLWFLYFCNNECFHDFFFHQTNLIGQKIRNSFFTKFVKTSAKQLICHEIARL